MILWLLYRFAGILAGLCSPFVGICIKRVKRAIAGFVGFCAMVYSYFFLMRPIGLKSGFMAIMRFLRLTLTEKS